MLLAVVNGVVSGLTPASVRRHMPCMLSFTIKVKDSTWRPRSFRAQEAEEGQ